MRRILSLMFSLGVGYLVSEYIYPMYSVTTHMNPLIVVSLGFLLHYFIAVIFVGQSRFTELFLLVGTVVWIYASFYNQETRFLMPSEQNPPLYFWFLSTLPIPILLIQLFAEKINGRIIILMALAIAGIMSVTHFLPFDLMTFGMLEIGIVLGFLFHYMIFYFQAAQLTKRMMRRLNKS